MNSYEKVIEIYGNIAGTTDRKRIVSLIDKSISVAGMWSVANSVDALDENRSCEDFSISHMTEYNKLFYHKY